MSAWFRRVRCEKDATAIDELLHPECEVHGLASDPVVGQVTAPAKDVELQLPADPE